MKWLWIVLLHWRFVPSMVAQNVIPESPSVGGVSEQTCFKITENDVKALYNQYNEALIGCDAVRVVALFWDRLEILILHKCSLMLQMSLSFRFCKIYVTNLSFTVLRYLHTNSTLVRSTFLLHRSVLIPTHSNFIRDTAKKKLAYYREYLASEPKETLIGDHVDLSGCNQAIYAGTSALVQNDLISNTTISSNFRFSFIFQTFDGKYWAIKTLHSSEFPNEDLILPT